MVSRLAESGIRPQPRRVIDHTRTHRPDVSRCRGRATKARGPTPHTTQTLNFISTTRPGHCMPSCKLTQSLCRRSTLMALMRLSNLQQPMSMPLQCTTMRTLSLSMRPFSHGGIALGILSSIALGIFSRCIYLSTRGDSAWYGTPIYVSTYPRAVPPGAFSVMGTILSFITFAHATDPSTTGGDGKQVPLFNGQREAFSAWFMMFTGFVAWKLTECYQLAEGNEARPPFPAPIYGTTDGPTEPDAEAYLEASAPGTPTPAAPPRPSARARTHQPRRHRCCKDRPKGLG